MVALPDLLESCVLVAVTVALVPVEGAVKLPLWSMVPALADHDTEGMDLPVFVSMAVHFELPPYDTVFGEHSTVMGVVLDCVQAAVTLVAAFIGTVQFPVPLQPPPDHPRNIDPG
jgi:hypothetical protein